MCDDTVHLTAFSMREQQKDLSNNLINGFCDFWLAKREGSPCPYPLMLSMDRWEQEYIKFCNAKWAADGRR